MSAVSKMGRAGRRVFVCGVGMTKVMVITEKDSVINGKDQRLITAFEKPGRREDFDYPQMAVEAGTKALKDAGVSYDDIEQAVVGYVYGESTCGQRALYELGLTGIPIYNVNNNCATGSTALMLAKQIIEGGIANCVLALGFEKMERGSLGMKWSDRTVPVDKHIETMSRAAEMTAAPMTSQIFGNAGQEHMKKYGTKPEHFAKIAWKNHKHSVNNSLSQFTKDYSLQEIMESNPIHEPLTKLQCCPTSDGGAAVIVCSEDFVNKRGLHENAVEILGMEMATDLPSTFNEDSCMKVAGYDMTKQAANRLFSKSGLSPQDVQVVELHDCFSANELITYEALGLCEEGKAGELIDNGDNTYGGKYVINPSGGLISKGHPLGATGLAQCTELCLQLRGECGKRQVPNARIALQHNLGLGGACVVGLYALGFPGHRSQKAHIRSVHTSASLQNQFRSNPVFNEIQEKLKQEGPTYVKKLKAIYCFKLTDGPQGKEGIWYVDAKNGEGSVEFGEKDVKPDCTFKMKDEDCFNVMTGKMNPQTAFMKGKLKISGNIGLAMKLKELQSSNLKSKL